MALNQRNAPVFLFQVARGVIADRLGMRSSVTTNGIPVSVEKITPTWLTAALCGDVVGAKVVDLHVGAGSDGTTSRRPIRVTYNEAGVDGGLPTRLFAKSSASLFSRAMLGLTGITVGEAIFFNELRPRVALRSPRGYFALADSASGRSIVLMDDLSAADWTFPDPMRDHVSERDAMDMVEQMAEYHAAFWGGREAAASLGRLPTPLQFQQRLNEVPGFQRQFRRGLDRSKELLPPRLWRQREHLWSAFMRSLQISSTGIPTLLHQDLHQGNWLRDPAGRMGLYDWQCVARGSWALDVSYALIATLSSESRLAWQQDMVRHYLDNLAARGVTGTPTMDQAWLDIRRQTMHAFVFGVCTNGQLPFLTPMQPNDYTERSIVRIGRAVDDLETLEALG